MIKDKKNKLLLKKRKSKISKFLIFIENGNFTSEKINIIYNGLITNPKVSIVKNKDVCDYIFVDFIDINLISGYKKDYSHKIIVIDYGDDPYSVLDVKCLMYFKRSVVNKRKLKLINYNRKIIPISHCLKNEVLYFKNINNKRDIDISVFFRKGKREHRTRVARFIANEFSNYKIHVGICGRHKEVGRTSIQMDYYNKMFRSKIVITCNPKNWEGDYRTWEALSSGAMVVVDKMLTPIVNPLIDKKHVVFYDRNNLEDLKTKILFYLKNPDLIEKIGKEGNSYALKYHKASNRIDEILSHLTNPGILRSKQERENERQKKREKRKILIEKKQKLNEEGKILEKYN